MITSERTQRMMEGVPDYYQDAKTYLAMQDAKARELDLIKAKLNDLQLQLDPATATWGLKYFEKELGLVVDETKPIDDRRSNVLSKKRGFGNFSAALIKTVALSFTNGEVDVTAYKKNLIYPEPFSYNQGSGSSSTFNQWVSGRLAVRNGSSNVHGRGLILSVVPGKPYTFSCYAQRASDNAKPYILLGNTPIGTEYASRILADGKAEVTFIPTTDTVYLRFLRSGPTNNASPAYFWDVQLEAGTSATLYEPRIDNEIGIRFIASVGTPPNLLDFQNAIDNIVHAHIGITYVFKYFTINDVHGMTIAQLNATELSNFSPFLETLE